jgi:hypothetical protein
MQPRAVLGYDTTGDGQLDAFDNNQVPPQHDPDRRAAPAAASRAARGAPASNGWRALTGGARQDGEIDAVAVQAANPAYGAEVAALQRRLDGCSLAGFKALADELEDAIGALEKVGATAEEIRPLNDRFEGLQNGRVDAAEQAAYGGGGGQSLAAQIEALEQRLQEREADGADQDELEEMEEALEAKQSYRAAAEEYDDDDAYVDGFETEDRDSRWIAGDGDYGAFSPLQQLHGDLIPPRSPHSRHAIRTNK